MHTKAFNQYLKLQNKDKKINGSLHYHLYIFFSHFLAHSIQISQ